MELGRGGNGERWFNVSMQRRPQGITYFSCMVECMEEDGVLVDKLTSQKVVPRKAWRGS